MAHDQDVRRRGIEQAVLHYVLERPAAKDTAEGVRHWWLRNDTGRTAREVEDVLAGLAAKGWFSVRGMQGEAGEDALVYELNASCTNEIRSYLAESRADSGSPSEPAAPPEDVSEGKRCG